jgi:parallel beta-helix repeat protein
MNSVILLQRSIEFFLQRATALLALTLFLLSPTLAGAATFCVDTVTELDNALEAFVNNNEDTVIRIAQGNYGVQGATYQTDSDLEIIGGYTDGTCGARSVDPSLTILRPVLSNTLGFWTKNLNVSSVTFAQTPSQVDLAAFGTLTSNGVLRVTRVRFEGPAVDGNRLFGDEVYVTEALVYNSGSAADAFNSCALTVTRPNDSGDIIAIKHSTIANNPADGLCLGSIGSDDSFAVRLDNNILYGNATVTAGRVDLRLRQTSQYVLHNNIISSNIFTFGAANPGASANNIPNNPQFLNAAANDFQLQISSPAINSGSNVPYGGLPQFDIIGNPRLVGPAPDRGAYESAVDGTEVLTVTSTADTNTVGTLRWALNQANLNPSYSAIYFNIPGACPRIITLISALPTITTPIGIAGYSQAGSDANSSVSGGSNAVICVGVVGGDAVDYGLRVPSGSGGSLAMSGLGLGGFSNSAVSLEAGAGSLLAGNQFGFTLTGGVFLGQNNIDILVAGSATYTQIGGPDIWQRNVITGGQGYGVALNSPSTRSLVEGNLIGIQPSGNSTAFAQNGIGIAMSSNDNTVRGNAIAGSTGAGVLIFSGSGNNVQNNTLGRKVGFNLCGLPPAPPCDLELSNASNGVLIQGNTSVANVIQNNVIANSAQAGIRATEGQRNFFYANKIWNSGEYGIDLGVFGRDANNSDSTTPGEANKPNAGQNYPTIGLAAGGAANGRVAGTLSTRNGRYLIQVFASFSCPGGRGQAQALIGTTAIDITNGIPGFADGSATFGANVTRQGGASLIGQFITVMASDINGGGYGNTSELSGCTTFALGSDVFANGFE